jgi:hypothetical protein
MAVARAAGRCGRHDDATCVVVSREKRVRSCPTCFHSHCFMRDAWRRWETLRAGPVTNAEISKMTMASPAGKRYSYSERLPPTMTHRRTGWRHCVILLPGMPYLRHGELRRATARASSSVKMRYQGVPVNWQNECVCPLFEKKSRQPSRFWKTS